MQKSRKLSKHAEAHFNLLRINLGEVELNKIEKIEENSANWLKKYKNLEVVYRGHDCTVPFLYTHTHTHTTHTGTHAHTAIKTNFPMPQIAKLPRYRMKCEHGGNRLEVAADRWRSGRTGLLEMLKVT